MAEYIEREAAVHLLMNRGRYLTKDLVMDASYEVSKIPAADVQPVVHGRWELEGGDDDLDLYGWCSVCNRHWHEDLIEKFNYCPNCGARMDGE